MTGPIARGTFTTGQSGAAGNGGDTLNIPYGVSTAYLSTRGLDSNNTIKTQKRVAGGAWVDQTTYSSDQSDAPVAVAANEEWRVVNVTQQGIKDVRYLFTCLTPLGAVAIAISMITQVATNSLMPDAADSTNKYLNSRSPHRNRAGQALTQLQIMLPTCYVASSTYVETNSGGVITYTATIEYPAGTFNRVKWFGSNTLATATGGQDLSDVCALSVAIPNDAQFWVNVWGSVDGTAIFPVTSGSSTFPCIDLGNGGALELSATVLTDRTGTGGTVNTTGNYNSFTPIVIAGFNTKASVAVIGDSRSRGAQEVHDASGDKGEENRSIGATNAYIALGKAGDFANLFITHGAYRMSIAKYCSYGSIAFGINDLTTDTATQLAANIATIIGFMPSMPFVVCTLTANPTSSDGYVTTANQSPANSAQNTKRTTFNDAVRANVSSYIPGAVGYWDIASATESSLNSGIFKAPPALTADGLHLNTTGSLLIKSSGVVTLSTLFSQTGSGGVTTDTFPEINAWQVKVSQGGNSVNSAKGYAAATNFVKAAKANGYFSSFLVLQLWSGNASSTKYPLIGSASETTGGTLTYAENVGKTTDGTGYVNTGYGIQSSPSGGFSVYLRTDIATAAGVVALMGSRDSAGAATTHNFRLGVNVGGDNQPLAGQVMGMYDGDAAVGTHTHSSAALAGTNKGLISISRADTSTERLFRNGQQIGSYGLGITPGVGGAALGVFCANFNSTFTQICPAGTSIGAYEVNSGRTPAQEALFYTDMQAYQTAMGRAVV